MSAGTVGCIFTRQRRVASSREVVGDQILEHVSTLLSPVMYPSCILADIVWNDSWAGLMGMEPYR